MGLAVDRHRFDEREFALFAEKLRSNLDALSRVLERPGFGTGPTTLGAEIEISIVDDRTRALPVGREALDRASDERVQLEIGRFNLEYNLDPLPMRGRPFRALEDQLTAAFAKLGGAVAPLGGRIVPVGILPTLRSEDVQPEALTDSPRYRALAEGLRRIRKRPFQVTIDGDDPLRTECDDVTLEAANTSLQVHLRVAPADFAAAYNAAQIATAAAIAVGANSPVFLEHRLWDETRVALFKQSIDARPSDQMHWHPPARVSFGHGWVRDGAYELFAESVAVFPPLLPILGKEDPVARVREGGAPLLEELRLHQSTIWRWNRAIYDPADGGHLRIEFRSLPSGPTPRDMAASTAFLLGATLGLMPDLDRMVPGFPFEYAHYNFYRAAQRGLDASLLWPFPDAPSPRELPAVEIVGRLLPVAERGLAEAGVEDGDIRSMLDVIRGRLDARTTGARWQRRALERLEVAAPRSEALAAMVDAYLKGVRTGKPVAEWSPAS